MVRRPSRRISIVIPPHIVGPSLMYSHLSASRSLAADGMHESLPLLLRTLLRDGTSQL